MPNHTSLASLFSDIADAIRAKTGDSAQIVADDFPTAIAAIPTGSVIPDGDNLSYGEAPLAGYAVVGCGLCTPLPHVGEAVVGDIL